MSDVLNPELYYRITDLPDAAAITGTEVVEAVQDGKNVKFTLAQLLVAGKSAYAVAVESGYEGTEAEWLKSLIGASAFEVAVKNGFKGTQTDWLLSLVGAKGQDGTNGEDGTDGTDGIDGTDGKSAFELAQAAGFEGDEAAFLLSLHGPSALDVLAAEFPQVTDAVSMAAFLKGAKGDKGDAGIGTRIVGTMDNVAALPDPVEAERLQQAYIVEKHLWVPVAGEWTDMGDLSGPEGMGLRIKGSLPSEDVLPNENNLAGDAYVINRAIFVFDGEAWVEFGVPGPTGMSAYQQAVEEGFEGSVVVWLASLKGEKGDKGDTGEKGDKGDAANALYLKGRVATAQDLPVESNLSDAYVVGSNVFAFTSEGWEDLGRFNGESAYELAVKNGFAGTMPQWLDSLNGTDGLSAYQAAVAGGFQGTEAEWLKSLHGRNLEIDGVAATEAALPAAPADATVLSYMVGTNLYIGTKGTWTNVGTIRGVDGTDGTNGLSALEQISEAFPEVVDAESLAVFLKGEKGDQGEKGDKGDAGKDGEAGPPLRVRGVFATEAEVLALADPLNGDFAVAARYHYVYDGSAWGKTLTMDGADGKDGIDGTNGKDGKDGTNGKDGTGLALKGTVANEAALPTEAPLGDAYIIEGDVFVMGAAGWFNAGPLQGEAGQDAYDLAVELGFVGSREEWINTITGTDGKSAFEIAQEANPELTDESAWLASLVGPQGEAGPMGPGVKIMGKLDSSTDLPAAVDYQAGDGFLINGNFWGKAGTTWVDCGPVQGPQGIQGIQGIQGVKGNKGDKGDRGASVLLFDRDPSTFDGAVTDVAMNTVTQGLWLKTSSTAWTFVGNFGGGNVYSPNNDGKQYIRVGGEWKEFNHYDLVATASTGACDISQGNVFVIDNSTATAKTISLLKPPAGRATTVVILVKGKAGAVTWPAASVVTWGDNMVPELGDKLTNVVLLWDGTQFVGSVGAKA